jgi:hypothetical protein
MEAIITYDELSNLVNARYKFLENSGILDTQHILQKIKDEFNLTTSEVWELIGLKDLTDFRLDE